MHNRATFKRRFVKIKSRPIFAVPKTHTWYSYSYEVPGR